VIETTPEVGRCRKTVASSNFRDNLFLVTVIDLDSDCGTVRIPKREFRLGKYDIEPRLAAPSAGSSRSSKGSTNHCWASSRVQITEPVPRE
jgi:hypothetical protein